MSSPEKKNPLRAHNPATPPVIALVEDDADDRAFISMALRESGLKGEILVFQNGTDFLESMKKGSPVPHLVITDIRMPLVTGFDVIHSMRTNTIYYKIPVVVLSTSGSEDDMDLAKKLGANAYYVKPYSLEEYCEITGKILDAQQRGDCRFELKATIAALIQLFLGGRQPVPAA